MAWRQHRKLAGIGAAALTVAALAVTGYSTGPARAASAAAAGPTGPTAATRPTTLTTPATSTKLAAFTKPAAFTSLTASTRAVATVQAGHHSSPRTLTLGMKGPDVKALQRRLSSLKYYPGRVDGTFGPDTQAALWAFQEINRIKETGVADAATRKALAHPRTYKSPRYRGKRATRVEVDQALEVVVVFKNNKITLISHASSGGGYYYDCGGYGCAQAVTPNGTYNTTAYLRGWVRVPLGAMYNPVFFIGRVYAIHGDTYVPKGPASHGCVRLPMDVANFFHTLVKTPGTQVHVFGKPQWER